MRVSIRYPSPRGRTNRGDVRALAVLLLDEAQVAGTVIPVIAPVKATGVKLRLVASFTNRMSYSMDISLNYGCDFSIVVRSVSLASSPLNQVVTR
jgi:hypothetical protein